MRVSATIMVSRDRVFDLARKRLGAERMDRNFSRDFDVALQAVDWQRHVEIEYTAPSNSMPNVYVEVIAKPEAAIEDFNRIVAYIETHCGRKKPNMWDEMFTWPMVVLYAIALGALVLMLVIRSRI